MALFNNTGYSICSISSSSPSSVVVAVVAAAAAAESVEIDKTMAAEKQPTPGEEVQRMPSARERGTRLSHP